VPIFDAGLLLILKGNSPGWTICEHAVIGPRTVQDQIQILGGAGQKNGVGEIEISGGIALPDMKDRIVLSTERLHQTE
jgi:hypothetical protein